MELEQIINVIDVIHIDTYSFTQQTSRQNVIGHKSIQTVLFHQMLYHKINNQEEFLCSTFSYLAYCNIEECRSLQLR